MIARCAQGLEGSPPKPREGVCVSRRTAGSPCSGGFPRPCGRGNPPHVLQSARGSAQFHAGGALPGARVLLRGGAGSSPCGRGATARAPRSPTPMRRFLPQCGSAFAQERAGLVEALDVPLSRKAEWSRAGGSGCFASDVVFSKGSLARWGVTRTFPRNPNVSLALGWCGDWFASEAEFSKGYHTLQAL